MKNLWILSLGIAAAATFSSRLFAADKAEKGDAVFVDEGDGDFDSVPMVKGANDAKAVAHPAAAAEPKAAGTDPKAAAESKPAVTVPVAEPKSQAAAPTDQPAVVGEPNVDGDGTPEASAPTPSDDSAAAPVEKVAAKKSKKAAGLFVVTQSECPMTREPASESERMITVKSAKKIWVEEVDGAWVRAFDKTGSPGYISRDCVK